MNRPYLSGYLAFIDLDDNVLLFSGFTGNMDVISRAFAARLRKASKGGSLGFLSGGELSYFKSRGYVTALPPDAERAAFLKLVAAKHADNLAAAKKSALLSLLLDYGCNLSCGYCYQKDLRPRKLGGKIGGELLDLVFRRHFNALFPGVKPENIYLTLYGGEPLQTSNLPVLSKVLEFAAANGVKTSAISNGIALEHFRSLLGPLPGQINSVQVTLDAGDYKGSSQQRASGAKFDRIVSGIHLMLDRRVQVSIRMHVNDRNYAGLLETVEYLRGQDIVGHPACFPHLAPVVDYTASDPDKFYQRVDGSHPIARKISEIFGYPLNSRISSMQGALSVPDQRLTHTIYCMHSRPNAFIVDPYGDLYGCLVEAGREEYRLGNVSRKGVTFTPTLKRNRTRNVGTVEECSRCPYALLCAGACANNARALHGDIFSPDCFDNRESIPEAIRFAYLKSRRRQR